MHCNLLQSFPKSETFSPSLSSFFHPTKIRTMDLENFRTMDFICSRCLHTSNFYSACTNHPVNFAEVTRSWYQHQQDKVNQLSTTTEIPSQQSLWSIFVIEHKIQEQISLICGGVQNDLTQPAIIPLDSLIHHEYQLDYRLIWKLGERRLNLHHQQVITRAPTKQLLLAARPFRVLLLFIDGIELNTRAAVFNQGELTGWVFLGKE